MLGEFSLVSMMSVSADDSRWLLTFKMVDVEESSKDEIVFNWLFLLIKKKMLFLYSLNTQNMGVKLNNKVKLKETIN